MWGFTVLAVPVVQLQLARIRRVTKRDSRAMALLSLSQYYGVLGCIYRNTVKGKVNAHPGALDCISWHKKKQPMAAA